MLSLYLVMLVLHVVYFVMVIWLLIRFYIWMHREPAVPASELRLMEVRLTLDEMITYWRWRKGAGCEIATYYVDALQSVRKNVFGEVMAPRTSDGLHFAMVDLKADLDRGKHRELLEQCLFVLTKVNDELMVANDEFMWPPVWDIIAAIETVLGRTNSKSAIENSQ